MNDIQMINALNEGTIVEEDIQNSKQKLIEQLLDQHGTGRLLFRNTRAAIKGFIDQYLTKQFLRNILLVYLIFIMLVNVLRDSIQGVENSLLMLMIAIGLLLGWLLAISKLEVWKSILITILSGGTILLIRVGRLGSLIWSLFGQILDLGPQTWQWIWEKGEVPRSLTIPTGIAEHEQVDGHFPEFLEN